MSDMTSEGDTLTEVHHPPEQVQAAGAGRRGPRPRQTDGSAPTSALRRGKIAGTYQAALHGRAPRGKPAQALKCPVLIRGRS